MLRWRARNDEDQRPGGAGQHPCCLAPGIAQEFAPSVSADGRDVVQQHGARCARSCFPGTMPRSSNRSGTTGIRTVQGGGDTLLIARPRRYLGPVPPWRGTRVCGQP